MELPQGEENTTCVSRGENKNNVIGVFFCCGNSGSSNKLRDFSCVTGKTTFGVANNSGNKCQTVRVSSVTDFFFLTN